jgi:hypothetical protein
MQAYGIAHFRRDSNAAADAILSKSIGNRQMSQ